MINVLLVGIGGALGAIARYGISLLPIKTTFPILTLLTNLLGAVLIGIIVGISIQRNMDEKWILLCKTGICGGFTTFSTFSLETVQLFQNGSYLLATIYCVLSVLLCIIGVIFGQYLILHTCK